MARTTKVAVSAVTIAAVVVATPDAAHAQGSTAAATAPPPLVALEHGPAAQSEMRGPIERFETDLRTFERYYSAQTTPTSPDREKAMRALYGGWLDALKSLDFARMSQDGKVDYLLFKNYLQHALRQLDIEARRRAEEAPLVPFGETILGFEDARRRMEPVDAERTAAELAALAKRIAETRKEVEAGLHASATAGAVKPSKVVANRAAGTVSSLRDTLKRWYGFYNGYDPTFTWWAAEPYKAADAALGDYAAFLREKVVGLKPGGDDTAIVGDPIGRDALMSELAYEMIPYTPEELIAIANREFAWCEAEMKKASREMGCGDDWKKALERVKQDHVAPGKQPELIKKLALEAIAFVDQHDLVTVPPLARESWRMEMMSPERQLVNPFFLGGENIIVSYPTSTMTQEQKLMSMRGNNVHFARATVFHELIPGHHLQQYTQARYRTWRRLFNTPFWVEGNALYWEMRFWDLGFAKTPEDKVGMLFWRMHRCARIIFSLSFHLGKMTPHQCIDFLVDRVGHERDNAAAEVRRSLNGSYGPLYQAAYMLGGLQLRALHHELVDGGKMTERAFNDAVLQQNAIPIEMVRAALTDQPLTPDYTPQWRFGE